MGGDKKERERERRRRRSHSSFKRWEEEENGGWKRKSDKKLHSQPTQKPTTHTSISALLGGGGGRNDINPGKNFRISHNAEKGKKFFCIHYSVILWWGLGAKTSSFPFPFLFLPLDFVNQLCISPEVAPKNATTRST